MREETRGAEQARAALSTDEYEGRVQPLAETQESLAVRVVDVLDKIVELPESVENFAQEIGLLTRVEEVMREAHSLLARPETGPETIAAETEAIELLLQAQRVNPKGGGGGGGSSPGGGGSGDTEDSALALLGRGSEENAQTVERSARQATGVTGGEFPAEFRAGLDAYFGSLEESRQGG